uniref:Beta-glucosidase n=1 Tax=uncultured bacterium Contigcl_1539 TaxID=1393650 RepID=W0FLV2_9BACT|nr:beta-glucosidase [uncultured bacterium Contigcl_1539]
MDIEKILQDLTIEEKAALVAGTDFMFTNPIPRLGVPSLQMADGPHGLRKKIGKDAIGISRSEPATTFPPAVTTASSWNPENARRMGEAIARECRYYGVHTLLGPGVNIKRNPLCGRNFEYFSEDPLLAGMMGAAEVKGVQSLGVGSCVKHFALNNTENYRFMGNSIASENTIRNLYLKQFEIIVKQAKPAALMCAYNQINGSFCSENKWLLTDVLRDEWGFEGLVMTDWGAVHDRIEGLKAGLDLEMPGDTVICRKWIRDAAKDGSLPIEDLDKACRNILRWIDKYVKPADPEEVDWNAHHELSGEIAADSAVLLKNEGVLPFAGEEKLHIEGDFYEHMRYQGAGSSLINPTFLTSPKDAFEENGIRDHSLVESDVILYFAGLPDDYESEGEDRAHMRLPEEQIRRIDELAESGKKIVVVLFCGSPVELPFSDKVDAILNMYLPGQNGGKAVYELLFGKKNPSGKLAETWPIRYEDVPGAESYGKGIFEIYEEGMEVGYRYYNKHDIPVRFPFGFGLSYTTFAHTDWAKDDNVYTQTITNTGERFGGEVAMLYLDGELAGFEKVYLAPGESKTVTITLTEEKQTYPDTYTVPAKPPKYPLTLESRFSDYQGTFFGRILLKVLFSVVNRQKKQAARMPDGREKEAALKSALFLKRIMESNSARSLSMSGGTQFPYNLAEGVVEIANGHLFKGLSRILTKINAPKLPKEEV